MKSSLFAVIFLIPMLAAAVGGRQPVSPEAAAQLRKEAVALRQQAAADPRNADILVKLGFVYARLKRPDDARRAFESAVALDPARAEAHYMLGLIYEKKGMKDKALASWRACLESAKEPGMRATAARHIHNLTAGK
ncbi:MAG: tetratricopeptide repeat protein [Elusimicrobiales bacterium]|nr:tetratricopeptide repeat protein [Elusimicrobiales bacterium]